MNIKEPQQNTDELLDGVLRELSEAPDNADMEASFSECIRSVTKPHDSRILYRAPQESQFISIFSMTHIQKIIGVSVIAASLLLVIGFVAISKQQDSYDDVIGAALEDGTAYDVAYNDTDSLSDVSAENNIDDPVSGSEEATSPTTGSVQSGTQDLNTLLASIDVMFASDDIEDSALQASFSDTSASDAFTQTYDI